MESRHYQLLNSIHRLIRALLALCCFLGFQAYSARSGVARQLAESALRKSGKFADDAAMNGLERRFATMIQRHGEKSEAFLRQTGRQGLEILEKSGTWAGDLLEMYASKPGAALFVFGDRQKLDWVLQHGRTAFKALIHHPCAADVLIRKYGKNGAEMALALDRDAALRLARLERSGWMNQRFPTTDSFNSFVRKYGSSGVRFVWNHRKSLAVAGAMTWFLSDPESFINGSRSLMSPLWSQIWNQTTGLEKSGLVVIFLFILWLVFRKIQVWTRPFRRIYSSIVASAPPKEN